MSLLSPSWKTKIIVATLLAVIGAIVSLRVVLHRPLNEKLSSSTAVYDSKQRLLRLTLSQDDKYRLWLPLKEISPLLIRSVLVHEDRHFYRHIAFNPVSLARAAWRTYVKGDRRIGGSTITMQLARLIYKINSRNFSGKIMQIARALQLELIYSKDEILEAYFNLVPYGRNIEGVGAASLVYFNRQANKLSLSEALTLALIPQSPAKRTRRMDGNEALRAARSALFAELVKEMPKLLQYESTIASPMEPAEIKDLPFLAPHYVDYIISEKPRGPQVVTLLDLDLQRVVERQVSGYLRANSRIGINNAAVLVLDARKMEVKAMQGSADFFNAAISGQVNGTMSKRSPGSALKPFIYALAFDQGLINPMTLIKDTPLSVGPFSPENFDGQFAGPLSARDALIRSRNIPAVFLASWLSNPSFYDFLRRAEVSGLKSEKHYGPSLVIGGGGEVTMMELVRLYAMLANGGLLRSVRFLGEDTSDKGVRLLSEEASFITLDILKDLPRPDERYEREWARDHFPVSWKTGTSYGFKDAWTVGVFGPYAMAIWVGNFDGEANPSFIGIRAAAPLFFRIAEAIKAEGFDLSLPPRAHPKNIARVEVCALSGKISTAHCPRKKHTWFIPGKSPIDECDVHREVMIEDATGLKACYPFTAPVRAEVFEFWPSDVLKVFKDAGMPRRNPPEASPSCRLAFADEGGTRPKITSPLTGLDYVLRQGNQSGTAISFQATTEADAREVYWFVNNSFVGKSAKNASFFWNATPGQHTVRAVDDKGGQDSRALRVTVAPSS